MFYWYWTSHVKLGSNEHLGLSYYSICQAYQLLQVEQKTCKKLEFYKNIPDNSPL
jgi:hypothetical protein